MAFLSSSLLIILFVSPLTLLCSASSSNNLLSLSVGNPEHVIKSRNNNFTAGFYDVVNGKGTTLSLRRNGNLMMALMVFQVHIGHFNGLAPKLEDYGLVLQRRLTLDSDGNLRVYSRRTWKDQWYVSWEAFSAGCNIHGVCGENSFCTYLPYSGRKCLCLPGYRFKDETDWSLGCLPEFHLPCNRPEESRFLKIHKGNFFRYDLGSFPNFTYDQCKDLCLNFCNCKGFQYTFDGSKFTCYPKYVLVNGNLPSTFDTDFFLKLPKSSAFEFTHEFSHTKCENVKSVKLGRQDTALLEVLLWLALAVGGFEVLFIFFVWCLTRKNSSNKQHSYEYLTVNGFRKYSYSELKEATRGFKEEIGSGAGGIVYKGALKDGRVAAIKRLNEANQIESEFLAEVNIIGRLNHMNLISMWGYCAEGNHRMLVYEFMENGSLAENLESKNKSSLDWSKRYEIALGTARGLAYLHEECLEWVLHCDIKPQNILLDSDYQPKVADFGLSKLQNRNDVKNPSFSRIRGTRGYMAPEWVFNLSITSKVDVYSYGIVVLEMITGKSLRVDGPDYLHHGRLVTWVRDKKKKGKEKEISSWVEQIVDPTVEGSFDKKTMEILLTLALECVEEDREARPTMGRVVEMLQDHVDYSFHDFDF
ncbi:hypothetical protein K1719_043498 [Acacia pycnantha]|nr:hypothetical protein K1719_043498 [Acacia pycnantha]